MLISFPETIQEICEIIVITIALYSISKWLYKNHTKQLLIYFYGYILSVTLVYVIPLPTLLVTIPYITPLYFMLGILLHQDLLQKNIITHKHVTYDKPHTNENWIQLVLSTGLSALNSTKYATIIIEQTDDISPFLRVPFVIKTSINKEIVRLLFNPAVYDGTRMVWIQSNGSILSNQALWNHTEYDPHNIPMQKELALLYTSKTDTIVCFINQEKRTCDLIINGKTLDNLTSNHTYQLLQKHIAHKHYTTKNQKDTDENKQSHSF